VSAVNVADQVCTYFGGPYDPTTHTYRTPALSVANLDGPIVRRSVPKRDDHTTDYSLGTPGVPAGCLILVQLERGQEQRVAVAGAVSGVKHVSWSVRMHCFIRATFEFVEDLQDVCYQLLDPRPHRSRPHPRHRRVRSRLRRRPAGRRGRLPVAALDRRAGVDQPERPVQGLSARRVRR
jgi:hypothetical protein